MTADDDEGTPTETWGACKGTGTDKHKIYTFSHYLYTPFLTPVSYLKQGTYLLMTSHCYGALVSPSIPASSRHRDNNPDRLQRILADRVTEQRLRHCGRAWELSFLLVGSGYDGPTNQPTHVRVEALEGGRGV